MPSRTPHTTHDVTSPVEDIDTGSTHTTPEPGIALCLSGGGYRAMLFHLGALARLAELGYLPRLERISSVSGGSITAAVLGCHWEQLDVAAPGVIERFIRLVVAPVRQLAGKTIDVKAGVLGVFGPGSVADRVADAYNAVLFHGATLQQLPVHPRFVINATNVQSGALWRFMRPYMRDYRVGSVPNPETLLAVAVAASSAFPPFLSPMRLRLQPSDYAPAGPTEDLHREPYLSDVRLSDGGVYDNLGLETAWKRYDTILVSDAGGRLKPEDDPKGDWGRHSRRVIDVVNNQVRSLRTRLLIDSFDRKVRKGTYWGIRTDIRSYQLSDALPCPVDRTTVLANVDTRLARLDPDLQERLINWGYAVCDAAMRRRVDSTLPPPTGFPYPRAGI